MLNFARMGIALAILAYFFLNILFIKSLARIEHEHEILQKRLETVEFMIEVKNAN